MSRRSAVPRLLTVGCLALGLGLAGRCGGAEPGFRRVVGLPDHQVRVEGGGPSNQVYRLERSSDLMTWERISQLIPSSGNFRFLDPIAAASSQRFFRFTVAPVTAVDDWKNQVEFPNDLFQTRDTEDPSAVAWVKFIIFPEDPARVYFQDSGRYVLHYDFARTRLPQFQGLSRAQFDAVSLHLAGQQAVLGTVLFPPGAGVAEYAIQFAGQDPYSPEWVTGYFDAVRRSVDAPEGARAFYFPTFEQTEAARTAESALLARGIPLGDTRRWVSGDQVYAPGWAVGRLRFVAAAELSAAYQDGRLKPDDILVTDGVPAEVPFVAGILSLAPGTPNSHVALFAEAAAIPYAYAAGAALRTQLADWEGRDVVVRCGVRYGYSEVVVVDVQGQLDASTRAQLRQLKATPAAEILPMLARGRLWEPVDGLTPADRCYFGGKASNYGILRRITPNNSEPAIALSFDLWNGFLDQVLPAGQTLRDAIASQLASFTNYPPDLAAVATRLAVVRGWITQVANFTPQQQQEITNALAGFDPARKIRFRSSSNAEDAKSFVGAGLYDSYSGCLLDDLDADAAGPCRCDPGESNGRGVFRAIRKVYASFYNDNAFLERLRHRIAERQVGMALLVHYSAPDETELANGVAKLWRQRLSFGGSQLTGRLVTQSGAIPVTNPQGNAQPEIVEIQGEWPLLMQHSSLVPLGTSVLAWTADYTALFNLMSRVYADYSARAGYVEPAGPLLDFEYKKIQPGRLMLKQVRELPSPEPEQVDPFLVNTPATYWVFNREASDVMADHRLKCLLTLETANLRLAETNLAACFYTGGRWECRLGDTLVTLTGSPATWPGAQHSVVQDPSRGRVVRDRWTIGSGPEQRTYVLTTAVPKVDPVAGLILTPRDLKKWLEVTYTTPVPTLNGLGEPGTTTAENVQLVAAPDLSTLAPQPPESYRAGSWSIDISFLASTNGNNAPLPGVDPNLWGTLPAYYPSWAHATLRGVLPEPLVLRGYYATTGVLGHKERYQWHLFEPALDPALSPAQRDALEAANIRLIYIERQPYEGSAAVMILGVDGRWRRP